MSPRKSHISEPSRKVPIAAHCQVLVAGGGIAGVAAAVAAARNGASVCLLEKTCALGGLATLGNVTIWLPICDGMGRQVIAGLGEELLKLSVADLKQDNRSARFVGVPPCWLPGGDPAQRQKSRYRTEFNPSSYFLALEKLIADSGIKLLYDTRICAVQRQGDRISHVIVENQSGRRAFACDTVVDATGDANLCWFGGEETESLDTNVLTGWFYHLDREGLHLHQLTNSYDPNAGTDGAEGPFFRGDDAEQITAQILGSRELLRQRLARLRSEHPDDDIQVITPATIACLRMTRRLAGDFALGKRHMHEWFEDTVGLTGDWRERGPVYAIPFRALCGKVNRNLLTAGRCFAADTTIWDATRAIPTCAVTGEAAGTAAALAAGRTGGDLTALAVTELQAQLRRQGVLLDPALAARAAD